MDARILQDRISKGMGVAARRSGVAAGLFRPKGIVAPLSARNKVIELPVVFLPNGGAVSYGQALWRGIYDASYSRAGDYLVGLERTFFVACQLPGLPVECVLTNRVISIVRPLPAVQSGYSGFFAEPGAVVITQWPASLLESGGHGNPGEPGKARLGNWTLLLPSGIAAPQVGDVVNDDLGGVYAVGIAEQGALGWRLLVRQVGV
jgi:hypothetical protein